MSILCDGGGLATVTIDQWRSGPHWRSQEVTKAELVPFLVVLMLWRRAHLRMPYSKHNHKQSANPIRSATGVEYLRATRRRRDHYAGMGAYLVVINVQLARGQVKVIRAQRILNREQVAINRNQSIVAHSHRSAAGSSRRNRVAAYAQLWQVKSLTRRHSSSTTSTSAAGRCR